MWTLTRNRSWMLATNVLFVTGLLALLVMRFDTMPVLVGLAGMGAAAMLALMPQVAVNLASILLYANIPAAFRSVAPGTQILAGAFFLVLAVACARRFILDGRMAFDRTLGLMLALAAVMLVATFWAVDRNVAFARIIQFGTEGILLYWLMLQTVQTRRALRGVMWSVAMTAALLASLSIYQVATGDYAQKFGGLAQRQLRHEIEAQLAGTHLPRPGPAAVRVSDRAAGPVADPNRHAQNLLLALPLALYLMRRQRRATAKLVTLGIAGAITLGIVLTYSRGAFLAIGLLVAAAALWRVVHRIRLLVGLVVLVLIACIAAPTYVQRVGTIVNSLALLDEDTEETPDPAIRGRATEMLAALAAFVDHPLIGVGPGQYTPFYSQMYQQRSDVKFRSIAVPREPHDLYVAIAAETGLIGFTLFIGMVAWLARDLATARRIFRESDPDLSRLSTALLFSVLVYLGCGLFLHLAYERYFWFLLGTAGAALQIARRESWRAVLTEEADA